VALGSPRASQYKLIDLADGERDVILVQMAGGSIKVEPAKTKEARKDLASTLAERKELAAESLGHIDHKWCVDLSCDWLDEQGVFEIISLL
jgi:hypothetical protein